MENKIDEELCTKCRLCVEVCPCNVLGVSKTGSSYFIPERLSICLDCGQCMAVCKTRAISVNGFEYGKDVVPLPENEVSQETFMNFLANRRSVRNYKSKPVPNAIIQQLLESIEFAPFGAEPEKMEITVVNNREVIEMALPYMEGFLNNIVKWIENPLISFMIRKKNSREKYNTVKNHVYPMSKLENYKLEYGDRITRGAPALLILHANKDAEEHTNNSLIFATYLMLAAHSMGLGASMNGLVPAAINKVKKLKEIFKIPEKNEAVISVILGYPKYKYKNAIRRQKHKVNWVG